MNQKQLYYGVAYYPEAWPREQITSDLDCMKKYGFNTVRIAEFAWAQMEPQEGKYDFSLFREVVDGAKERGMFVVMCTPSATPPAWLQDKDPTVWLLNDKGIRLNHGARKDCCLSNENYLSACDKIVDAMGREFGKDDNIIGWQIDNEIYIHAGGVGCTCPRCASAYKQYLSKRYATIDVLNREWDTFVWSMRYTSFDQVHPYNTAIWNHPSLVSAWDEFQNELAVSFIHRQIDILKKYTKAPISTDMMPTLGLSYEKMGKKTDIVQFNHYNTEGDLYIVGLWSRFMRAQKDKPFWVTETSPNWNGSALAKYTRPPKFAVANVMLPLILGADMTMFWLWRAHYGGHELMHGSVVDTWGRPMHNIDEITQLGQDMKILSSYLLENQVTKSKVALHFTHKAWQLFDAQKIMPEFEYKNAVSEWIYKPLAEMHFGMDVIGSMADLSDYEMLISPFVLTLDENQMIDKILSFVQNGGTWVVLPMTDIRNESGAKYLHAPMGHLEDVTGVKILFTMPKGKTYEAVTEDGQTYQSVDCIYNALSGDEHSQTIARYRGDFLDGHGAITATPYGKGKIIMVGFVPHAETLKNIMMSLLKEKNILRDTASDNVVTVYRGESGNLFCAVEIYNNSGRVSIPYDGVDLLTGRKYHKDEETELSPYSYLFVKKK